jgi:hypothetical protein
LQQQIILILLLRCDYDIHNAGALERSGGALTKNGSDIPVLWDRARITDPLKPVPNEPGTVIPFTGPRRLVSANVLGNAAGCVAFWRRLGFERIELELEALDVSRLFGDIGSAIKRVAQRDDPKRIAEDDDPLSGYCLSIWGWRPSVPGPSQLGRMRIYDFEPSRLGPIGRYGIIGDLNGPNVLMGSDLVEPLKALAVFVCEVNGLTPVLAVESSGAPTTVSEARLVADDAMFSLLAERRVLESLDHATLRLYRGMTSAIYLGGGVTPDVPLGNVQIPVRLGKHLLKVLCLHLG